MYWIHVAEERDKGHFLVNVVLNFHIQLNEGNFMIG